MRQGKLSELIHNSADYPDLDDCRVEVWFREIEDLPGPDAYKVVPGSKLVVARSAFRNNSSVYTINGNRSNFTEVTTLLKDRGIDLDHKRFLILQGEVESIAQMKPKAPNEHEDGLLEYLEDIIGTSKYKEPIDETLIQVDQLNEERSEKMNRLRLIEKDKASLEEKKKDAETWLRNKNELARAQNKIYQYYMLGHSRNEQELQGSIDALTQQLQQEKDKNKDTIGAIEELQHAYDERVKAFEVVKKETAPLVKQLQALEKQEVTLQEKRKHIMAKGKKLTKSLKEDHNARAEAERLIENHAESVEKHRKEVEQLESSLESEEAELEKITEGLKGDMHILLWLLLLRSSRKPPLTDKTEVFHAQIEAKQKELEPWNAKINKKQAELDLATNERNMLAEKAEAIQASVDDAVKSVEDLTGEKRAKEEQLGQLKSELVALKREVAAGEKKLQVAPLFPVSSPVAHSGPIRRAWRNKSRN
ncbi:hypothetical protein M407DRAFT_26046 [Tulasnella calospora MUT 4182]|uniref:RecF/RecN/SMC N-terminal domain-containing protein n=1 Tax=Tulasnella calospora MUT 4182 TaxID=1051891 RepID=A0A0C3QF17_9AGAM|nr:hypothetical protein M407DRAFT_26046 [Tulasnella calospora MUT 4182]